MPADEQMTAAQAATLKRLAQDVPQPSTNKGLRLFHFSAD